MTLLFKSGFSRLVAGGLYPALLAIFFIINCTQSGAGASDGAQLLAANALPADAALGKKIFFDTSLSEPAGQSCGSCHSPAAGFATPAAGMVNGITPGVHANRTGPRNTPTAAYAVFSPDVYFDEDVGTWVGGQFLDHRAKDLEEQAGGPFLNFVEMANSDRAQVITKLAASEYAQMFRAIYGSNIFENTDLAYDAMTRAIAAFERSPEVSPFNSRFDRYLAGRDALTAQELRGLALFRGKAGCEACHPSSGDAPLFTDFTNDNTGVPKNLNNPFYTMPAAINPAGAAFIDRGLGVIAKDSKFDGRFKVPTLRNVAKTAPYFHNGAFTTLRDVVRFYNTACASGNPDGWAAPEVSANRNCKEMGDLHLTEQEIDDIVTFLGTLEDN